MHAPEIRSCQAAGSAMHRNLSFSRAAEQICVFGRRCRAAGALDPPCLRPHCCCPHDSLIVEPFLILLWDRVVTLWDRERVEALVATRAGAYEKTALWKQRRPELERVDELIGP